MFVGMTSDSSVEDGVYEVSSDLGNRTEAHFAPRDYGPGLAGVGICLLCRDPELRRRVSWDKKKNIIYMDVVLKRPEFVRLEHEERRQRVMRRLIVEVPETIAKYKPKDFDLPRFAADLKEWFTDLPPEPPRDPNAPLTPDIYSLPKIQWSPPRFTRG